MRKVSKFGQVRESHGKSGNFFVERLKGQGKSGENF